jgi:hypothetical protein
MDQLHQIAFSKDAPRLNLRIKNGNQSFQNRILEINALGLQGEDNIRRAYDGTVYFGTLKHSMPDSKGNLEVLNDFILPPS